MTATPPKQVGLIEAVKVEDLERSLAHQARHRLGDPVAFAGGQVGEGQPQIGEKVDEPVLVPVPELVVQAGEQARHGPEHTPGRSEQPAEERRALASTAARAEQVPSEETD